MSGDIAPKLRRHRPPRGRKMNNGVGAVMVQQSNTTAMSVRPSPVKSRQMSFEDPPVIPVDRAVTRNPLHPAGEAGGLCRDAGVVMAAMRAACHGRVRRRARERPGAHRADRQHAREHSITSRERSPPHWHARAFHAAMVQRNCHQELGVVSGPERATMTARLRRRAQAPGAKAGFVRMRHQGEAR